MRFLPHCWSSILAPWTLFWKGPSFHCWLVWPVFLGHPARQTVLWSLWKSEGLYVALYKEVCFFRVEVMVVSGPLIRLMVLGSQQWKKMVNVSPDVFNFISNLNHSWWPQDAQDLTNCCLFFTRIL